jgi:hypothetical protein
MTNHHRDIGLVQGVWILAGLLVIVADWQENTNSTFSSRPFAGLRQQMEVWFYSE